MTGGLEHAARMLDAELHLAWRRVPTRDGARGFADRDEDTVTLAARAALPLLERWDGPGPAALVLASVTPPYWGGGNVQPLAELLDLAGDLLALELTATPRDGVTAVRLGAALADGGAPALVVAAHRGAQHDGDEGDGAAALLIGRDGGVAELLAGPARVEEARERWRHAGDVSEHEGDPTVTAAGVGPRVRTVVGDAVAPGVISLASPRGAARVERSLGGAGDAVAARAGLLGAAHPLARLVAGADRAQTLVVTANGLTEVIGARPLEGARQVAERARAALAGGVEVERRPSESGAVEGFAPYQSLPRAFRERGAEMRLEARRCRGCARVLYPPPAGPCAACGAHGPHQPVRLGREGVVLTLTRDHVYPDGEVTGMAVVDVDGGGRFYGQTVPGAAVAVGERVRLVPRVLHHGGAVVQYFWKVEPCR